MPQRIDDYKRGSEWHKWDLHTHTPLSILENGYPHLPNGEPDWEQYVTKLEATDISVLGVTDYFTIEGYKKLKEFKESGRLQNIKCLLPNIEFRLDTIISSRRDGQHPRRLNFHVIFSDEVSVQDIEEHFLYDIQFDYEGNPQAPDGTRKLKVSNIAELGKRLISEHPDFANQNPLVLGASKVVVSTREIIDKLRDSRFSGKYLVVLPEELSSLIDWNGQDHLVRKLVLQQSDMVFSPSTRTREWCLGKDPYMEGEQKFIQEFKSLKPCIHGSDAHSLDAIDKPCSKRFGNHICLDDQTDCDMRYLWIKSDPTFEGLKQLKYEPDDRVFIGAKSPNPSRGGYTIDRFEIARTDINNELSMAGNNQPLNFGLVAVCGGKGAGKTAYVDLLANSFMDRSQTPDPNSFVQRVSAPDIELKTKVTFKNGEVFEKNLADGSYFENSDVVYIAQAALEAFIGESSSLENYVNDLIFDSPPIKNSILRYDFERLYATTARTKAELVQISNDIVQLEASTTPARLEAIRLGLIKANAESIDLRQQITTLQGRIGDEKVRLAESQQKHITELKTKLSTFQQLLALLEQAQGITSQQMKIFNQLTISANKLILELKLGATLSEIIYPDLQKLQSHMTTTQNSIVEIVKETEKAQQLLEGHESDVKQHAKLIDRLHQAEATIAGLNTQGQLLADDQKSLGSKLTNRKEKLNQLLAGIIAQKDKYGQIIDAFSTQKAAILSDLSFIPEIQFDENGFISALTDVVDSRGAKVNPSDQGSDTKAITELYRKVATGDASAIDPLVDEADKLVLLLGQHLKASHAIDRSDFYRILYDNYLTIVPTVKYKNVGLSKLSLGQKATVLLKIYLAEGDKPIIIDSHDDHLDNQYIMEELISAIRVAKKLRQIILVSNNANVVINSDAEQVIIASHIAGSIHYESGSIENPKIRDSILKVLEGGSDAFRKRQMKYRIGR